MTIGVDADADQFDAEMRDIHDGIDTLRDRIERPMRFGGGGGGGGGLVAGIRGAGLAIGAAASAVWAFERALSSAEKQGMELVDTAEELGLTLSELTGKDMSRFAESMEQASIDATIMKNDFQEMLLPFSTIKNDFRQAWNIWRAGSVEAYNLEVKRIELGRERKGIDKEIEQAQKTLNQELERQARSQEQLLRKEKERAAFARIDERMQGAMAALSREQFMAQQDRRRDEMFRTSGRSARAIEFELAKQLEAFNEREQFAERRQQIRETSREEQRAYRADVETASHTKGTEAAAEELLRLQRARSELTLQIAITNEVR